MLKGRRLSRCPWALQKLGPSSDFPQREGELGTLCSASLQASQLQEAQDPTTDAGLWSAGDSQGQSNKGPDCRES